MKYFYECNTCKSSGSIEEIFEVTEEQYGNTYKCNHCGAEIFEDDLVQFKLYEDEKYDVPLVNYHCHRDDSNILTGGDSIVKPKDYMLRAIELGHPAISSCTHGYQGIYHDVYEHSFYTKCGDCGKILVGHQKECKCGSSNVTKERLKFLYVVEAYWVKSLKDDPKDRANAHMIWIAKTDEGRKQINRLLSYVSEMDYIYYGRPRADLDLIEEYLNPNDVAMTSACFDESMTVPTLEGIKKITSVKNGDLVLTHKGTWERVKYKTTRKYNGTMYEFKIQGNLENIKCTEDHLFPVVRMEYKKGISDKITWKKAKDLTTRDRILNSIDKGYEKIDFVDFSNSISENVYNKKRKNIPKNISMTNEFLEILGIYCAEGNLGYGGSSITFTLNSKDNMIVSKVLNHMEKVFEVSSNPRIKRGTLGLDITFGSVELFDIFSSMFSQGAINKRVPSFIKKIKPSLQMQFIKGLFNGDGHCRKDKSGVSFCTISKQLFYDVMDILERNDIKPVCGIIKEKTDPKGVHHKEAYYIEINNYDFFDYWDDFRRSVDDFTFNWTEKMTLIPKKNIVIDGVHYSHKKVSKIMPYEYDGSVHCLNIENISSFKVSNISVHNCIGFAKYDNMEEIIERLHNHFGDSMYLEYQCHVNREQSEYNQFLQEMSLKYNIKTIIGLDSHYIYPKQHLERNNYINQKRKNSSYGDDSELGWFMCYPDSKTIFSRLDAQGVLSEEEIFTSLKNTLELLQCEDIVFTKERKMPISKKYNGISNINRKKIYLELIQSKFKEHMSKLKRNGILTKDLLELYKSELKKETDIIIKGDVHDYFLANYDIMRYGEEKYDGIITPTGRGSGVSNYSNFLLQFTKIDRISHPLTMYPERFLTLDRLKSGQFPDLDMNLSDQQPFIKAQEDIFGEGHQYWMLSYGTLQEKAAFKMYAGSVGLDPQVANDISKGISKFEDACKYGMIEDDDGNEILDPDIKIENYIAQEHLRTYEESKKYIGVVSDIKSSPCSFLLYTQDDIRSEVGIMRLKGKNGKADKLVACIEGSVADSYGYLKNDLLKVEVCNIIGKFYNRINKPIPDALELYKLVEGDKEVWDIYAKGYTMGINQFEKRPTAEKMMTYKPNNPVEVFLAVAAVRPGFKSYINKFLNREEHNYGVPVFDNLIQTKEMPYTYLLFQEFLMKAMIFAGIEATDTVDVVKAISKKNVAKIMKQKEKFLNGLSEKVLKDVGDDSGKAMKIAEDIWGVIEDAGQYCFNAPHSASVGTDSLYGAWAKAHYPIYFYETMLRIFSEKKDKNKCSLIKQEMEEYKGITLTPIEWGYDNTNINAMEKENMITDSMLTISNMSQSMAEAMKLIYEKLGDDCDFIDILDELYSMEEKPPQLSTKIKILIKLQYFVKFGADLKLLKVFEIYNEYKSVNSIPKDSENKIGRIAYSFCKEVYSKNKDPESVRLKNENPRTKKVWEVEFLSRAKQFDFSGFMKTIFTRIPNKEQSIYKKIIWDLSYKKYTLKPIPSGLALFYVERLTKSGKYISCENLSTGKSELMRLPEINDGTIESQYIIIQDGTPVYEAWKGEKIYHIHNFELVELDGARKKKVEVEE